MQNKNRGFIGVVLLIAAVATIGSYGAYKLISKNIKTPEAKALEEKIKNDIDASHRKFNIERELLKQMKLEEKELAKLTTTIEKTFAGLTVTFANNDIFLEKKGSTALKNAIAKKDPDLKKEIESKRQEINALMVDLKADINAGVIDQIKKDVVEIQAAVAELAGIVNALTPDNSGLTQAEIDAFEAIVNAVQQQVNNAVAPVAAIVTPAEIQAQENVIVQVQEQINQLEQQLQQVQTIGGNPPIVEPDSPQSPVTPPAEAQNPPPIDVNVHNPADPPEGDPLVPTPGKPKLIQGDNRD